MVVEMLKCFFVMKVMMTFIIGIFIIGIFIIGIFIIGIFIMAIMTISCEALEENECMLEVENAGKAHVTSLTPTHQENHTCLEI